MNITPPTMTRGDLEPDAMITIGDARSDADFVSLTPDQVLVSGEIGGVVKFSGQPDTVTPAIDGKSAVLRRSWVLGDTEDVGRMYVVVDVIWPNGEHQHFPASEPLILDIRRAPGDA